MNKPAPRFGTIGGLLGPTAPDLPKVQLARRATTPPTAPTTAEDRPTSDPPTKTRPRKAKARAVGRFVYAGVTPTVRVQAPRLAAATGRTIADLAVLGATRLNAPKATRKAPAAAAATTLPLSVRPTRDVLVDMQIRVTAQQRAWLDTRASALEDMSLRRFVGLALETQLTVEAGVLKALDEAAGASARATKKTM